MIQPPHLTSIGHPQREPPKNVAFHALGRDFVLPTKSEASTGGEKMAEPLQILRAAPEKV
jgi:hypothetical protein